MTYKWILESTVHALHDEQIMEHGGLPGIKNLAGIQSALDRPKNLLSYGNPEPDIAALAASYAFGIAQNHGYHDGNKRTSLVVLEIFLMLNGKELSADDTQCVFIIESVAGSEVSEEQLADWIRSHITDYS